jgi:3'-phosphoadenosine 5'-phosphosulfate sulfotransferase (PAPS reductase)/FAD synthetase
MPHNVRMSATLTRDVDIRLHEVPDLLSYDHIIVGFSGGKDSLACLLVLLSMGVPRSRIELWHHDIDGQGQTFMDWGCTPAYCRAVAEAFGVRILFSWRQGGFMREMLRENALTAPVVFERADGTQGLSGGTRGTLSTRRMFPQVSPDLNVRWCSGKLKIDVMDSAIRGDERFDGRRTLVITGERAQESANRARYATFEPHRSHVKKRHVDHWRPVHAWSEDQVWDIIRRYGVVPHPAYVLGWSRLSCMCCIFGNANQWATIAAVFPDRFEMVATFEAEFGKTIHRTLTVRDLAAMGTPYPSAIARPNLAFASEQPEWQDTVVIDPDAWTIPSGAFGDGAGPI